MFTNSLPCFVISTVALAVSLRWCFNNRSLFFALFTASSCSSFFFLWTRFLPPAFTQDGHRALVGMCVCSCSSRSCLKTLAGTAKPQGLLHTSPSCYHVCAPLLPPQLPTLVSCFSSALGSPSASAFVAIWWLKPSPTPLLLLLDSFTACSSLRFNQFRSYKTRTWTRCCPRL